MTALTPAMAGPHDHTTPLDALSARPSWRSVLRSLKHPLAVVLVVQAALSLTLVWSNTAFGDEADYLWVGRLVLAHWTNGSPLPDVADRLSGSPVIYPPIGAFADSLGGLAGARILSLVFMLGATVLLYLTASRLIGRAGAVFAAALWALSEPALRLTFATYDPLSVLLTAASAWLAVQAGYRRQRVALVAASAVALALANATAYSGIVIDPVLIAFAFASWLTCMRARQAWFSAVLLAGGVAGVFALVLAVTGSGEGTAAVFHRVSNDRQGLLLVVNDDWKFSGLIIVLAMLGAGAAIVSESRRRASLLALLGCAVLAVPIAQLRFHTAWSLDKHLAYGIWFAAMAAGYGCSKLIRWFPGARKRMVATLCILALTYPAITGWRLAWNQFHSWPDARSFIASFEPLTVQNHGLIYTSGLKHVAEYYSPQVKGWNLWSTNGMSLDPKAVPRRAWSAYYSSTLASRRYAIVALFYNTTFASTSELPGSMLLGSPGRRTYRDLLNLVGNNSGTPGLPTLTLSLEKDPSYRLAAVGPYDTSNLSGSHNYGVFAIWERVA